jgi:hypothetical protein
MRSVSSATLARSERFISLTPQDLRVSVSPADMRAIASVRLIPALRTTEVSFSTTDRSENPGSDTISFQIPGPGPFVIQPLTPHPAILDGTTPLLQLDFQLDRFC